MFEGSKALTMQKNKISELLLKRAGQWENPAVIKSREYGLVCAVRVQFLNFDRTQSTMFAFFIQLLIFDFEKDLNG